MRPRSSTWEWGAFADAMRYAKGSCDSWAAKRLFAATRASFARWLCRNRVAHVSIATAGRSVTVHGVGDLDPRYQIKQFGIHSVRHRKKETGNHDGQSSVS
jgi:hypothetical protein